MPQIIPPPYTVVGEHQRFPGISTASGDAIVLVAYDEGSEGGVGSSDVETNLATAHFICRACNSFAAFREMAFALDNFLYSIRSDVEELGLLSGPHA
jgi:hypothetical protein